MHIRSNRSKIYAQLFWDIFLKKYMTISDAHVLP